MACTEKAENNHYNHNKITVVFFIVLGEQSNSLYGWRPLVIRQHMGLCVMLDRQPRESQVGM